MLEEKIEIIIDSFNITNKTISIAKFSTIYKDGLIVSRNVIDRCGFVPGEIEKVKAYIGMNSEPEIKYLESIWTDELIKQYQEFIANQEII